MVYYDARSEQLNRNVRDKLKNQIIPSRQHDLSMAPNFFVTVNGPDESAAIAKRQVCYDGALGARDIHSLQFYGSHKPVYENAYTISSMYHDGTLKMYINHLAEPKNPEDRPEYHTSQFNTWEMTGNADTFRQGARAYRNARDWAKKQRDDAIRQANERADVGTKAPTGNAGGSPALSFVTASIGFRGLYHESGVSDIAG